MNTSNPIPRYEQPITPEDQGGISSRNLKVWKAVALVASYNSNVFPNSHQAVKSAVPESIEVQAQRVIDEATQITINASNTSAEVVIGSESAALQAVQAAYEQPQGDK